MSFPKCPADLKENGKAAWTSGAKLWDEGVLTERDMRAWETYCRAVDEVAHCTEVIEQDGEYHLTKNGCIVQHPAINRRRDAEKTMWRYEQAFGLVPEKRNKRPAAKTTAVARRKR